MTKLGWLIMWFVCGFLGYILHWVFYRQEAKKQGVVFDQIFLSTIFYPLFWCFLAGFCSIPLIMFIRYGDGYRDMVRQGKQWQRQRKGLRGDDPVGI